MENKLIGAKYFHRQKGVRGKVSQKQQERGVSLGTEVTVFPWATEVLSR